VAESRLQQIAEAGRAYAVVAELTRDPDPEPTHAYQADRQSGAGNCVCGYAEHHRRHPHTFRPMRSFKGRCVCALPAGARCHTEEVRRDG
jgi:hypothetical protein